MSQFYIRLFVFIVCGLTLWPASAEKYWLTHCQGELPEKASPVIDGEATVSVATLFQADEMENLIGNSITALRFGIVSRLKLDNVSVWIADDLESQPVRCVNVAKSDLKSGWNEVALDNPLTITGKPIYIGYSFSQPSKCNVIPVYPDNGIFPLFLNKGEGWANISSDHPGALCVEAGIEGDNLPEYGLEIVSTTAEYPIVEAGSAAYLKVDFINTGVNSFSQFSYRVSHPSGFTEEEICVTPVAPREKGSFLVRLPLGNPSLPEPAIVSVTAIEGENLTIYPCGETNIEVAEAPLLIRNVLIEEFSNEFCNNCPAASQAIHDVISSLAQPSRVSLATHHAGSSYDPFTIEASKEYECFYTGSKYSPMAMFDRTHIDGELNIIPSTEETVSKCLATEMGRTAEASLSVNPYIDFKNGLIEIEAQGTIMTQSPVNLYLFVTEDNVPAICQSGVSGPYIHEAMLRSTGPVWGIPVETDPDGCYSQKIRAEFKEEWKLQDCKIIAFIAYTDSDSPSRRGVLQSISLPLAYAKEADLFSGIENAFDSSSSIVIEIRDSKLEISGDYISATVFGTDGIVRNPGALSAGFYIVRVTLPGGKTVTRKTISYN